MIELGLEREPYREPRFKLPRAERVEILKQILAAEGSGIYSLQLLVLRSVMLEAQEKEHDTAIELIATAARGLRLSHMWALALIEEAML